MCGYIGKFSKEPIDYKLMDQCNDIQICRGPDEKKTINNKFQNTSISTKGRHDPCVGLRAVPIAEAMMACVLADHILRNRAQCG